MELNEALGWMLISLGTAVLTAVLVSMWAKSKGRTSIFASDKGLEEVALSLIWGAGSTPPAKRDDGFIELRPTMGVRLGAPVIGAFVVCVTDLSPLLELFGLYEPSQQWWGYAAIWVLLAFTAVQLNFVQRVTYRDDYIACIGVDPRPQVRDLSELVDISVHPKRPALVLTFARELPLYIPKFISHREAFLAEMERIAAENRARGQTARPGGLAERFGF